MAVGGVTMRPQTVNMDHPKRTDHVWYKVLPRVSKCVLCGAITVNPPPEHPTPDWWEAERYDALTDQERAMCPMEDKDP